MDARKYRCVLRAGIVLRLSHDGMGANLRKPIKLVDWYLEDRTYGIILDK